MKKTFDRMLYNQEIDMNKLVDNTNNNFQYLFNKIEELESEIKRLNSKK